MRRAGHVVCYESGCKHVQNFSRIIEGLHGSTILYIDTAQFHVRQKTSTQSRV